MDICRACGRFSAARPPAARVLCRSCDASVQHGPDWVTASGLRIVAGATHRGAVRRLVHRLKYEAMPGIASVLADLMVPCLPPAATALVPVPRAAVRRWRYGVDPGDALARALSDRTGVPVVAALHPGWWWPHHAGRGDGSRSRVRLRTSMDVTPVNASGWVLIDDVATSGATLETAALELGGIPSAGLVATAPSRMPSTVIAKGQRP